MLDLSEYLEEGQEDLTAGTPAEELPKPEDMPEKAVTIGHLYHLNSGLQVTTTGPTLYDDPGSINLDDLTGPAILLMQTRSAEFPGGVEIPYNGDHADAAEVHVHAVPLMRAEIPSTRRPVVVAAGAIIGIENWHTIRLLSGEAEIRAALNARERNRQAAELREQMDLPAAEKIA
jgi:hypothetical protein